MAVCSSTSIICGCLQPILPHSGTRFKSHSFSIKSSEFLSSNSSLSLISNYQLPKLQSCSFTKRNSHRVSVVFAVQSNIFRVIQTVIKTGKDGVEAGTNLVPDSVPRPVARLSVTVVATALTLFIMRSVLSTVFFSLAFMGFIYFIYLALNKDKGPKMDDSNVSKPGSTDEAIEEARKIMEKYK